MRSLVLGASLLLAAPLALAAPYPPPSPVQAHRATEAIVIDGVLNETAWSREPAVGPLTQEDPIEGAPASQRTLIWVLFDDDAIYVGAHMVDERPDSVMARLSRRDNLEGADAFAIAFDTFRDRRTGYYFGISAAGTLLDGVLMNDGWDDDSWDGVWEGHARRDAQGWSAELRIPLSQLRFAGGERMVWGVNFTRVIPRRNEEARLVFTPNGESGFVSRFPDLVGLDGIRPVRKIELLPYTTGKAEYLVHDDADPFHDGSSYSPAMGVDLRTSLGSKLTLNATVNPDFGQVEIDPAVVNLSDVESFFQEKRPFFTEGLSVFRCGNNGASDYWSFNWPEPVFFYSRRIGRAPGAELADDVEFADVPLAVRILGAAKITGQPMPRFNVGMLHAVTGREEADFERADRTRGTAAVEPLSYYGVLRGLRSFNREQQGLGLMVLETARALEGTGLGGQFSRNALTATMDGWTALDPKKDWVASGYVSASRVDGSAERIEALQRNSRRYYQRPDRGDLGVDPGATSLQGYAARVWVNREKGPWFSNSAFGVISPGYEHNDLGFSSRADIVNAHAGAGYAWNKPAGWRKNMHVLGAVAQCFNYAGQRTLDEYYLGASLEQMNALSWDFSGGWVGRCTSDRGTRGGPAMTNPAGAWGNLYFDTNSNAKLYFWASVNPGVDVEGSREVSYQSGLTWKPSPSLSLSAGPQFSTNHQDAMYVTQATDPLAAATYGGRYVFATLDQKTAAAELRMDWSLTPALSVQLYAQPLVSSGRYTGYKELSRSDSYEFLVYGRDGGSTIDLGAGTADPDGAGPAPAVDLFDPENPDFTYRTVRGNLVIRWEYLPGSTAYVVWTQDRSGSTEDGRFDLRPSLSELGRTPANNVFMVKLSHHFEL